MIKFNCKNCGHKISVTSKYAGKKGKCPKCKTIVIVPHINNDDKLLKLLDLDSKIEQTEPELRLKKDTPPQRIDSLSADGHNVTNEFLSKPTMEEKPPERKLPWILDIFLYPISMSGLINLGIFWLLPIIIGVIQFFLPIPYIGLIAMVIITGYMFYFFMECIRDSAIGGIRAPENIASLPDKDGALMQAMEIVASIVVFWGPAIAYFMYKAYWQPIGINSYDPKTDIYFWLILGYGIFFFPMGILTLAMFDSSSAFNPLLWIISIIKTFFQYCGLVLFLCLLSWMVSRIAFHFEQNIAFLFFFNLILIYFAMIQSHLIGRFYYRNSKKLNWDA